MKLQELLEELDKDYVPVSHSRIDSLLKTQMIALQTVIQGIEILQNSQQPSFLDDKPLA